MSASSKKKLRKEQNAAQLTEKQIKEQQDAKKLRIYTTVFAIAMALILIIAAVTVVDKLIAKTGIRERNTVALTVDDVELTCEDLNFYYIDLINNFYNNLYSTYGSEASLYASLMYGVDFNSPLSTQVYSEEDGTTWADYFLDMAINNATDMVAIANAATAAGYTMTEEEQTSTNEIIESLRASATEMLGYETFEEYLQSYYGNAATEEAFLKYYNTTYLAQSYIASHQESLSYDDADLRAYEADKLNQFSSYTYNSYYLSVSNFLEGGTTDDEGNVSHSDEEWAAAEAAAEAAAKQIIGNGTTTVKAFNDAIAALKINEGSDASSTAYTDQLYSNVNSYIRDWVTDESRKTGDSACIANVSTNEDGNDDLYGYYVVNFTGSTDNAFPMANVRHLLVSFEGGTTDDYGTTTYSDEEKKAARDEAEKLLAEWKSGEATEDSFAALVTEKTDDTASAATGGLYEDISPDSNYVANFLNWAIDDSRQVGDTDIVETEYGCHIMYYVGDSTTTYRDSLIETALFNHDHDTWYNSIVDAATVVEGNTSLINGNVTISTSTY